MAKLGTNSVLSISSRREQKGNEMVAKLLASISFAVFCWVGLGTPFIWLKNSNSQNEAMYQLLQMGTPAALLLIFGFIAIFKIRSHAAELMRFGPLMCFVAYLLISLAWSPISLFEKISIMMSISLCVAAAIATLITLGLQNTFFIILVSTSAYVLASWMSHQPNLYQPLANLLFNYGLAALLGFGFIVRFVVFETRKLPSKFTLFVFLVGCVYLLLHASFSISSASADTVSQAWVVFRSDHGLFLNVNLHNRVLQASFVVSLLVLLLLRNKRQVSYEISFYIVSSLAIVLAVLIIEHRASTGRFVMFGALGSFLLTLLWNEFKILTAKRQNIRIVAFAIIAASALIVAIAFGTELYAIGNDVLAKLFERRDFFSRYEIWTNSLSLLSFGQLVSGVGLDGFWAGEHKLSNLDQALKIQAHAHNGFVDMLLQSGIISVVLLVIAWFHTARKLHLSSLAAENDRLPFLSVFYLGSLGLVLMNTFESVILPTSSATLLPFTLLLVLLLLPIALSFNEPRGLDDMDPEPETLKAIKTE